MNLAKLLVAGTSIMNGRDKISYRANKHVYLPKFQSPGIPVPAKPGAETIAAPALPAIAPAAVKTQKLPALSPGPVRATSWTSKLNPISLWRGPEMAAQGAPAVVQAELSLDKVKVVHNDLSDADVEVVPIKSRTADKTAVPVLPPPEKSWEFLAERMFHATAD
jgi:hypothetical protein